MNFIGLKSKGYEKFRSGRFSDIVVYYGITKMVELVQEIPVDLCIVYNSKNFDMKKDYSTGIAGICFFVIVLMTIAIVIFCK